MTLTTKVLKSKGYTPDEKAQHAIWAHCANLSFLGSIQDYLEAGIEIELCVTKDTEAGKFDGMGFSGIGLYLKGKVTAMFNKDIGSKKDKNGRYFSEHDLENLVEKYDELEISKSKWTESFLIPTEIVGIWFTREYYNKMDKTYHNKYFKRLGIDNLPITIID